MRPDPSGRRRCAAVLLAALFAYAFSANLLPSALFLYVLSNGLQFRVVSDPCFQSGAWTRHMPRLVAENPADCWS